MVGGRDGVVNRGGRVGGRDRGLHEGGNFTKAQRSFPDLKEADSLSLRLPVWLLLLKPSGWNGGHNLGVTGERGVSLWIPEARLKANVGDLEGASVVINGAYFHRLVVGYMVRSAPREGRLSPPKIGVRRT